MYNRTIYKLYKNSYNILIKFNKEKVIKIKNHTINTIINGVDNKCP